MRGQMDMKIAEGLLDLIAELEPLRPGADNALLCGKDLDHQDTLYYGGKVLAEGFGKRDYPTDPIGFIVQAPLAIRFLLARVKELESIIVDCDWTRMNEVARRLGVPLMINRKLMPQPREQRTNPETGETEYWDGTAWSEFPF